MPARNLVLIGFMGTGKSTVGRLCAERMNFPFRDSDAVIEERAGCSIAHLFTTQGEAVFRRLEHEVIAELAATPNLVVATGGGAVLDPENAARLQAGGLVVLLTAPAEAVLERIGDARSRPLLADASDPHTRITQLLEERSARYRSAAHQTVDTTGRTPDEVATELIARFLEGLLP